MNQYFLPNYILIYNMMRIRKNNSVYTDFVSLGAAPIIPLQNSGYIPLQTGWSERVSICARDSLVSPLSLLLFAQMYLL